jgi:Domain of unknown function (DUF4602)
MSIPVHTFDPQVYGIVKKTENKKDKAEFYGKERQRLPSSERNASHPALEVSSVHDMYETLKNIEKLHEDAMNGKSRRKHMHAQLIALGAKVYIRFRC